MVKTAVEDGIYLTVRVLPQGGRDQVDHLDESPSGDFFLKIRVKVPPVEGQANKAVTLLLAEVLQVPKGQVSLHKGQKSRIKTFFVAGNPERLRSLLLPFKSP
jgi:uncharacterized protein (TIGR00251 family)